MHAIKIWYYSGNDKSNSNIGRGIILLVILKANLLDFRFYYVSSIVPVLRLTRAFLLYLHNKGDPPPPLFI